MPDSTRRKGRPKAFTAKPEQTTIQSLDRALTVLELLAAHTGLTLSEIAERLDQSPATIYRVLATLEAREMVEQEFPSQTWHIGAMAFRVGSSFLRRSSLVERARPFMRQLMEETGETSNLGIEKGGQVMFVSQAETHESIRAFFPPGTLSPMHASGIGKALLSRFTDDQIARIVANQPLERFTDKTITDAARLSEDIAATRARGYAVDDEEKAAGMRCVAAPVLNLHGEPVAGISVSGPTQRMPADQIDRIGALVRDTARALSRALGAPDG